MRSTPCLWHSQGLPGSLVIIRSCLITVVPPLQNSASRKTTKHQALACPVQTPVCSAQCLHCSLMGVVMVQDVCFHPIAAHQSNPPREILFHLGLTWSSRCVSMAGCRRTCAFVTARSGCCEPWFHCESPHTVSVQQMLSLPHLHLLCWQSDPEGLKIFWVPLVQVGHLESARMSASYNHPQVYLAASEIHVNEEVAESTVSHRVPSAAQ